MRSVLVAALAVSVLAFLVSGEPMSAQNPVAKLPVQVNAWGKLKGQVVLKKAMPALANVAAAMAAHPDKACCTAAPGNQQVDETWVVDPKTSGVANVIIFLKPAGNNQFLPVLPADQTRNDNPTLDQPFCSFVPHVQAIYPSYFDGKKQVATGQVFTVTNAAKVAHNCRMVGNPLYNPGANMLLPPAAKQNVALKPQPLPVLVECNIHPWMKAWVAVFDHPYFAVTKADGTYEIPNVPAGVPLTLMAWHEATGWVQGRNGRAVNFNPGANTEDIAVK